MDTKNQLRNLGSQSWYNLRGTSNDTYQQAYESLSADQKNAVNQLNGPVMVTGGPGTGKTHILILRICTLVLEAGIRPDNILFFVQTDAAVTSMRKQLLLLIGHDANNLNIYTFKTFCNDLLQTNLFIREQNCLIEISGLQHIELFKKLVDNFPKYHPLKHYRGDVYAEIKNLEWLFSTIKKEGWTTQFINEKISEAIEPSPIWLQASINEFDNYQLLMQSGNFYSPDDIFSLALKAFEEDYQQKFQHILVDEFEDITGSEYQLLSALLNNRERPNILVAGDANQSIYRLQRTNMENIFRFSQRYAKDLIAISLDTNHRSTESIQTISVCKEYETTRHEIIEITRKIEQLISQGTEPHNIAVIFSDENYSEEFRQYFDLKNIPLYQQLNRDILKIQLVKKIFRILHYLVAEHDIPYSGDALLFEILHYDFYNIPPLEIAKITVEVNNRKHKGEATSIRRLLQDRINTPAKTLFETNVHKELGITGNMLEKLIGDLPNVTLQTLLQNLVRDAEVLPYILKNSQKIWLVQVLTALFDFIKEETSRSQDLSLQQLMQAIDLMMDNDMSVPLTEIAGTENGVKLLTVQESKGLAYEHVFLAGCNASSWENKKIPAREFRFPASMFLSPSSSNEEQMSRLFYVALTRSQKNLYLSYARHNPGGKRLVPSMFLIEIVDKYNLKVEKELPVKELIQEYELSIITGRPARSEKAEEDFVSNLLSKFVMNVTALNNYLRCPLEFYYKNIIRVPYGKSEATEFGSAIHFAIQRLFEKMKLNPFEQFPAKIDMLDDYKWHMNQRRQYFTHEAFFRRLEYGNEVLGNYYDKYINSWSKIVAIERNIKSVTAKGIPIKGKLDKLEFNGREVNVVDYKSGDYNKALGRMNPPDEDEPNGGDYWRQAVFYKILVDNYPGKSWQVVSTEFDFIEPGKDKEYHKHRIALRPPDTETVSQQIGDVWQKIQNRDFYKGCGKERCYWCSLVNVR